MTTLELEVRSVPQGDRLVRPMLDELAREYHARYGHEVGVDALLAELEGYPAGDFAPPRGDLVLLLDAGTPVAGGAFRRRVEAELGPSSLLGRPEARDATGAPAVPTAELKRIWTSSSRRRQGLARRVLAELEARARAAGYERVYLTTGPRQPEAVGLYLAAGYSPLFDPAAERTEPLPFEKWLDAPGPGIA